MNLKKAREQNKLKQFIAERKGMVGDKVLFDKLLTSMVSGKSKVTQATSSQGSCENCSGTRTQKRKKKGV